MELLVVFKESEKMAGWRVRHIDDTHSSKKKM